MPKYVLMSPPLYDVDKTSMGRSIGSIHAGSLKAREQPILSSVTTTSGTQENTGGGLLRAAQRWGPV